MKAESSHVFKTCVTIKEVLSNELKSGLDIRKSIKVISHINRLDEKKHYFLNDFTKKCLIKIQYLVIIKTLSKLEIERNFPNSIKGVYQDPQ